MMIQGYINLFTIVISATVILQLPIFFILKKKKTGLIRQSSYLLCFWSFFIVVFATIILFNLPFHFSPEQSVLNLQPLQWLREGLRGKSQQKLSWRIRAVRSCRRQRTSSAGAPNLAKRLTRPFRRENLWTSS